MILGATGWRRPNADPDVPATWSLRPSYGKEDRMTADASDARDVADLIALTVTNVESVLSGLANLSTELARAPFFIRSLVEKEVSGATDLSFAEWSALFTDLAGRLGALRDAVARLENGAAADGSPARAAEFPDLVESIVALQDFLRKTPGKLNMVPPLLMGARERAEFVANVENQVSCLGVVVSALPQLALGATRLGLA